MFFKTGLSFCICFLICHYLCGQSTHVIKVYFLYGSKPRHAFRQTEKHLFGSIHGGHVSIGIDDSVVIGFSHSKGIHFFPMRKNFKGKYKVESINEFCKDSVQKKYTTFCIPVSDEQYIKLINILQGHLTQTPYDYAFFGMRCTSAAYDVLSHIDIFPLLSKRKNIFSNFYPRRLRNKFFRLAKEKNYSMHFQQGAKSRKWEKDILK